MKLLFVLVGLILFCKGIEKGSYQAISEQLEVMLNVTHDSSTDLVNKGTSRFIQKAKKIGIDTIYDNISSCDMLCTALQEGISIQTELSVKQNLYNFLIKYAMKQLEQGISKERIIKNIDNAIFNPNNISKRNKGTGMIRHRIGININAPNAMSDFAIPFSPFLLSYLFSS